VQAKVREGSPEGISGTTGDRICETGVLSREWKREGVMDEQSGKTGEEEVIGEVVGESELKELVPEWGWRRDKGSWFQRHGEPYRKERSVILIEDDVDGRARVTTDEVPSTTRIRRPAGGETVAVAAVVAWNGSPHFYSVKPFTRYNRFCNRRITVIYGHDTTIWYDTISMLLSWCRSVRS